MRRVQPPQQKRCGNTPRSKTPATPVRTQVRTPSKPQTPARQQSNKPIIESKRTVSPSSQKASEIQNTHRSQSTNQIYLANNQSNIHHSNNHQNKSKSGLHANSINSNANSNSNVQTNPQNIGKNANVKNQLQLKKKQPSIQKPVCNTRGSNRSNPKTKFDPNKLLPATNNPDFHYIFKKKIELCSKQVIQNYPPNIPSTKNDQNNGQFNYQVNAQNNIISKPCEPSAAAQYLEDVRLKFINLTHILRVVTESANKLKDEEQDMIVEMIIANVLRPLKYVDPNLLFAEVPQILPDPNWQHLDFVYLILNQLQAQLPTLLTYYFVKMLFPVLNSSDVNERIELIHFFKEFINCHFECHNQMAYDLAKIVRMHNELSDRPFAVWTILPILKYIFDIGGYDKYSGIIVNTIVPLLRDKYSFYFYPMIYDMLYFYSEKSPPNAKFVVDYLFKYWPHTSITKQSSYTSLLAEMLHKLSPQDLNTYLIPVFRLFANEVVSTSPKLAESSLSVWLIPDLEKVIDEHPGDVLEIMVPSIMKSANGHWWEGIRDIGKLVMSKILSKHDLSILKEITVTSVKKSNSEMINRYDRWSQIVNAAQANNYSVGDTMSKVEELFGEGFSKSEPEVTNSPNSPLNSPQSNMKRPSPLVSPPQPLTPHPPNEDRTSPRELNKIEYSSENSSSESSYENIENENSSENFNDAEEEEYSSSCMKPRIEPPMPLCMKPAQYPVDA
ncbi:hypothetical protein TRFO_27085 [Tritrichomonas foetus]|uniref:Phosphoprotein phosphatase n=1 Tax=Tritrichomonas foetus TaxID=1144522 RepID=A0A1J4K6D8_9EUKA|nr:hypothetical protein TRFO_27085 [Tritrichomonas foetus]|eukprot:OHT05262.1 hypothetical protein TRFO_27085 [Tritrichomonas foetus]